MILQNKLILYFLYVNYKKVSTEHSWDIITSWTRCIVIYINSFSDFFIETLAWLTFILTIHIFSFIFILNLILAYPRNTILCKVIKNNHNLKIYAILNSVCSFLCSQYMIILMILMGLKLKLSYILI